MQTSLDGVDRGVAQGTHGTRNETDESCLPSRQVDALVLRLIVLKPLLEVAVGSEVDSLVGTLTQRGQTNTSIQRAEAFLPHDGVQGMRGIAIFGNIERISHGVVLGLQTNLDDLHGGDDSHGLGNTGSETGEEGSTAGDGAGGLVGQELLVGLEGGEADGHLRHNAGQDGAEALVQAQRGLFLDDFDAGLDEAALGGAGLPCASRELHSHFDCVCPSSRRQFPERQFAVAGDGV